MKKPKVSVIVPVYNVERYLKKCLDSIIGQTYSNIELIVIDDGSTDGSGTICDQYKKIDQRVKVYHKENEGLGFTRNYGLKQATGEYVTFVDSDDYIAKNAIEFLIATALKTKADFVKTGFYRVQEGKTYSERRYEDKTYIGKYIKSTLSPLMLGSSPGKHDSIEMCVCGVLYSADIISRNKLSFVSERQYLSEDVLFNINYLHFSKKAVLSSYIGYFYTFNPHSLTKSYRKNRLEDSITLFKELRKQAEKDSYSKQELWRIATHFFINVRVCLAQENRDISKLTKQEMRNNIKRICYNKTVQDAIREYPVDELEFKQRVFLTLLKRKEILILEKLVDMGLMK